MNNFSTLRVLLEDKRPTTQQSLTKGLYGAAEREGQRRLSQKKEPPGAKARRKAESPKKKKKKPVASVTIGQSQSRFAKIKRTLQALFSKKALAKQAKHKALQSLAKREAPGDTHDRVTTQKLKSRVLASSVGVKSSDRPHGGHDMPSFVRPKIIPRSKRH